MNVVIVLLVLGVATVPPLALDGDWRPWMVAAAGAALALALPVGPAAAVAVVPWLLVAAHAAVRTWRLDAGSLAPAGRRVGALYGVVAAGALVTSRLGLELAGVGEPFVLLTSVHYLFAGCGALVLATWVGGRLGTVAVAATAVAPPMVAAGFVLDQPVLQVGGAAVLTIGACATGVGQLVAARRARPGLPGTLLVVSGFAPWVPMGLAVAWAAGAGIPIPTMAATHGVTNALAFTIAGLAARRLPADVDQYTRMVGLCLTWGTWAGACTGAAVGVWIIVIGAFYAAPVGAVVGFVAAVPLTAFVLRACRLATSPDDLAARLRTLFGVVVTLLLGPVIAVVVVNFHGGDGAGASLLLVVGAGAAFVLGVVLRRAARSLVRAWFPAAADEQVEVAA